MISVKLGWASIHGVGLMIGGSNIILKILLRKPNLADSKDSKFSKQSWIVEFNTVLLWPAQFNGDDQIELGPPTSECRPMQILNKPDLPYN